MRRAGESILYIIYIRPRIELRFETWGLRIHGWLVQVHRQMLRLSQARGRPSHWAHKRRNEAECVSEPREEHSTCGALAGQGCCLF
jgi:hypothetical protein